jgi:hypothetical protein
LTEFNFNQCLFSGVLPSEIQQLTLLNTFYIYGNAFTGLLPVFRANFSGSLSGGCIALWGNVGHSNCQQPYPCAGNCFEIPAPGCSGAAGTGAGGLCQCDVNGLSCSTTTRSASVLTTIPTTRATMRAATPSTIASITTATLSTTIGTTNHPPTALTLSSTIASSETTGTTSEETPVLTVLSLTSSLSLFVSTTSLASAAGSSSMLSPVSQSSSSTTTTIIARTDTTQYSLSWITYLAVSVAVLIVVVIIIMIVVCVVRRRSDAVKAEVVSFHGTIIANVKFVVKFRNVLGRVSSTRIVEDVYNALPLQTHSYRANDK